MQHNEEFKIIKLDTEKLEKDWKELSRALFELEQAERQNRSIQVHYSLYYDYKNPSKYKDFPVTRQVRLDGTGESVSLFNRNALRLELIETYSRGHF